MWTVREPDEFFSTFVTFDFLWRFNPGFSVLHQPSNTTNQKGKDHTPIYGPRIS